MKVKVGEFIYDSNQQPIMLVFENDESRKEVAKQISEMEEKSAVRKYLQAPQGMDEDELREFMKI